MPTNRSPISFFKRILFIVRVEGESAFPELIAGRFYLASVLRKPKIGRYIVFKSPLHQKNNLVKKVVDIRDGKFYVSGTFSWSTSSKDLGLISKSEILGTLF